MQRIKKGDTIQVISGNEIGARGEVKSLVLGWRWNRKEGTRVRDRDGDRVVIAGVNVRKKHQKRVSQTQTQTGIIEVEAPIHISNVMLVCPNCGEAARVSFGFDAEKKVRVCKRCDANID